MAQIVPELRDRQPDLPAPPPLDSEQARFRLFDAITTFLVRAAQTRPLVLILDDLHWADKSSLLLLRFLAREMVESRLLVLATYRDVEVSRGIRWPRSCRRSGRNAPSSASSSEPTVGFQGQ